MRSIPVSTVNRVRDFTAPAIGMCGPRQARLEVNDGVPAQVLSTDLKTPVVPVDAVLSTLRQTG
jgi:hypothetical protein